MSRSARQRAMLREMGITLWPPAGASIPASAGTPTGATRETAAAATVAAVAQSTAREAAAAPRPAAHAAAPPLAPHTPPPSARPSPAVVPAAAPAAAPDGEARARIAALDWPALRSAVAECQACGLCRTRRQTVFGVGHPQARWLVVGEAPGEQEDLQGEPFVGAAGQLLDSMLAALQLTRAADGSVPPERCVYIANTLKCRPPRNRNPEPAEMQACEPFLQRQIELLQPRLILAMGRFAVQALLRSSEPVGKLRGKVHAYHGVPLVVTYHPAYLLRNLPDKARAWDDLCLAAAVAERTGG
jgi:DNA polymerase